MSPCTKNWSHMHGISSSQIEVMGSSTPKRNQKYFYVCKNKPGSTQQTKDSEEEPWIVIKRKNRLWPVSGALVSFKLGQTTWWISTRTCNTTKEWNPPLPIYNRVSNRHLKRTDRDNHKLLYLEKQKSPTNKNKTH